MSDPFGIGTALQPQQPADPFGIGQQTATPSTPAPAAPAPTAAPPPAPMNDPFGIGEAAQQTTISTPAPPKLTKAQEVESAVKRIGETVIKEGVQYITDSAAFMKWWAQNPDAALHPGQGFTEPKTAEEWQKLGRGAVNVGLAMVPFGKGASAVVEKIPNLLVRKMAQAELSSAAAIGAWSATQAAVEGQDIGKAAVEGAVAGAAFPPLAKAGETVLGPAIARTLQGTGFVAGKTLGTLGKVVDKGLMRNEVYRDTRDVITHLADRALFTGEAVLRRAGLNPLADQLMESRVQHHLLASDWLARLNAIGYGLRPSPFAKLFGGKGSEQVRLMRNIWGQMLDSSDADAAKIAAKYTFGEDLLSRRTALKQVYDEIATRAENAGVLQTDPKTGKLRYFIRRKDWGLPHRYINLDEMLKPGKLQEEAFANLKAQYPRMTRNRMLKIISGLKQRQDMAFEQSSWEGMTYANLQGRRYNLPGYSLDPWATLPEYFSHMAREIVNHEHYGIPPTVTPASSVLEQTPGMWYHGGAPGLTPETLNPFHGSHQSLFGQGIYFTDTPSVAAGYAKSAAKRSGKSAIYEAAIQPKNILNLETAAPENVKSVFQRALNILNHQGETEHLAKALEKKGVTPEQLFDAYQKDTISVSHEMGLPTSEFVENFQDLMFSLQDAGYDALTHTGGKRVGKTLHKVLITLDPANVQSMKEIAPKVTPEQIVPYAGRATMEARFPKAFEGVDAIADPARRKVAERIVERQLGGVEVDLTAKKWAKAAQAQAIMKLGLSVVSQLSQVSAALVQTGMKDSVRDFVRLAANDPETHVRILRTGAFYDSLARSARMELMGGESKFVERVLHKTGFTYFDTLARQFGAVRGFTMAQHQAEALAELLPRREIAKGFEKQYIEKKIANIEKKFVILGLEPEKIMAQGGVLTEDDILRAGQKISTDVNFWSDSLTLPEYFRSPWGRIFTQFKSFMYQQSAFLKKAVVDPAMKDGNLAPLMRLLAVQGITGEAIGDIRSLLTLRQRDKQGFQRVVEDWGYAAALSMVYDLFRSLSFPGGATSVMFGPSVGDVSNVVQGTAEMAAGRPRRLVKQAIQTVPVFMGPLAPAGSVLSQAAGNLLYPPKEKK